MCTPASAGCHERRLCVMHRGMHTLKPHTVAARSQQRHPMLRARCLACPTPAAAPATAALLHCRLLLAAAAARAPGCRGWRPGMTPGASQTRSHARQIRGAARCPASAPGVWGVFAVGWQRAVGAARVVAAGVVEAVALPATARALRPLTPHLQCAHAGCAHVLVSARRHQHRRIRAHGAAARRSIGAVCPQQHA
jgi:hypothetical protein